MARRAARRGRGRLSSIDLLPEAAAPIVAWAMAELRAMTRTQVEIHAEFNERLATLSAELGEPIEPVSLSAFNRHSIRLAATARRLEETRAIAAAVTDRLGPEQADDLTIMVAETIKVLVFELLESTDEEGRPALGSKGAMELARALQSAVAAQNVSADRRRKIQAEFAAEAAKAVEKAGKARGMTADTVEAIKAQILGVGK